MNLFKCFKKASSYEVKDCYDAKERTLKFSTKSIYEFLHEAVGDDMDLCALNYFDTRITFGEMFRSINLIAKSLKYMGVKKGDVVTICMPNTPEAIEIFYAISKVGAIADLIHPLSSKREIIDCLKKTNSRILFLYDANYKKVASELETTRVYRTILLSLAISMNRPTRFIYNITKGLHIEKPGDDESILNWKEFLNFGYLYRNSVDTKVTAKSTALILHSGGTTGLPKGVMISNYSFNALASQGSINVLGVEPGDRILTVLPIFHGFGLGVCVHCPLSLKVEVILMPEFDSKRFVHMFAKYKPQVLAGVPSLWETMLHHPKFSSLDMSSLKYMISGGDNLSIAMERDINDFLKNHKAKIILSKGYGMTESVAATIYTFKDKNKIGSIGVPMIGNEVKICSPGTIEEVVTGVEGEICVTGPTLMNGYFEDELETRRILKKHSDGKTWLHTGDSGHIDEEGFIYFTSRIKRVIISSGFNVYPAQIESVLMKHSKVKSCCVIGIPHPHKIRVAKAFIVLKDNFVPSVKIEAELRLLCKEHLASFSWPKEYEFIEKLPMTLYNKADYRKLEREEEKVYERRRKN